MEVAETITAPVAPVDDFIVTSNVAEPTPEPEPVAVKADTVAEPEADAEAEPDPASDAGKALAKKRGSLQARINELTREKYDTKREAEAARAEAAAVRAELAALKAGAEPKPRPTQTETGEPRLEDFESHEAWVKAVTAWSVKEALAADRREREQAEQSRAAQTIAEQAQARIDKFRAETPDYDDVVNSAMIPPGAPGGAAVLAHLQHADLGPQLAYELGKTPAELARIVSLPPGFAVAALGRLEAQIESRTAAVNSGPAQPAISQAKPPIKPVGGSPVTSDDGAIPDDLPVDDYIRKMNAKDRAAARRR